MDEERAAQHRRYLLNRVIPHLEKMPEVDITTLSFSDRKNVAVFNLDAYAENHRYDADAPCAITNEYNCGREGCLAGWYLMMSVQDERLTGEEHRRIRGYDAEGLGEHFGLPGEAFTQGRLLFAALGSGVERRTRADDHGLNTKAALDKRKQYLLTLMTELGDITCERQESTSLTKL